MSLFANQGANKPGLFSGTGGTGTGTGTGTGGSGGGSLFANKSGGTGGTGGGSLFSGSGSGTGTGTGTGTGGSGGGSLFANKSGGTGTGTGTGTGSGGGSLFSSGTGGSLLGGGGSGGSYSLTAQNTNQQHEAELVGLLDKFGQALDTQNVITCQMKYPIYKVLSIEPPPQDIHQLKFLFDSRMWAEFEKNNPGQIGKFQFYVGFVCGVDTLETRVNNVSKLFNELNKTLGDFRAKQDSLSKAYEQKLRENINHVKRKNFLLLDKLLGVHALLEKVALQHNECERKPNEEMRLYNKYVSLESVPNEIQTRLLDIRLNRENAKVTKPRGALSNVTDNESKKNVMELLNKMKKGVEILSKMNKEDSSDVEQMMKYTESRGRLY